MSEETKMILKAINESRLELKSDMEAIRTELKSEIDSVRTELTTKIETVREELITEIQKVNEKVDRLNDRQEIHLIKMARIEEDHMLLLKKHKYS